MKGAARRATDGATATVACATAKSSLDTPEFCFIDQLQFCLGYHADPDKLECFALDNHHDGFTSLTIFSLVPYRQTVYNFHPY